LISTKRRFRELRKNRAKQIAHMLGETRGMIVSGEEEGSLDKPRKIIDFGEEKRITLAIQARTIKNAARRCIG